jgi:acyl CoA:acetate/3-ketoacid CoA transferase alpha subunit
MKAMEMRMKAKEAIAKIEDIMTLAYDGYGESMTPMERLRMINSVIDHYKKSLFKKENQDASS